MAKAENRTLSITAKIIDLLTKPLGSMQARFLLWAKSLVSGAKSVVASIFNMKTAVLGLATSFISLSTVKAFGEQADQLLKLSTATGDTVENLSELQATFELNNIAADGFTSTLRALLNKSREAQEGNVELLESFAAIGITLDDLRTLGPSQLFERMAAGLDQFRTAQEKSVALGKILPKQALELLNVLGGGLQKFQDTVRETRGAGATVTEQQAKIAERLNDSLTKVQFAIGGVSRALIEQFGPQAIAMLERLAKEITNNRDGIVRVAQAVGTGLVTAFSLASDAAIGFIELIEDFPLVGKKLIDTDALEKEAAELGRRLAKIRDEQLRASGMDPNSRDPLAVSGFLGAHGPEAAALQRRIDEIGQIIEGGLGAAMRSARKRLAEELAATANEVKLPVSPEVEWSKEDLARFRQGMQQAMGSVFNKPKGQGIVELGDPTEATQAVLKKDAQRLQRIAQMAPQVRELRDSLIEVQREAGVLELQEAQQKGLITLGQMQAALAGFNAELDRTQGKLGTGDFFGSFSNEAEDAAAQWTDFSAAGRDAARTIVDGGLDGVTNALTEIAVGTQATSEIWKQFGRAFLADLTRIVVKLALINALSAVFGGGSTFALEKGGVVQGSMGPPFKAYAKGGVTNGPTMALFGEGKNREAFVPLPDNRHIPVMLMGNAGGGPTFNISIAAMDSRDVQRVLAENGGAIAAIWRNWVDTRVGYRQFIQRTAA